MKTLYLIGGTMGVGKTTVASRLNEQLDRSVFLDGDWCWNAHPFQVTAETKEMVLQNIRFLLNQFLRCSAYRNIVFCWVMHEQSVIDAIVRGLDLSGCMLKTISLVCDAGTLTARLTKDVENGRRQPDVIPRSLARLGLYDALDSIKVDTSGKSVDAICAEIRSL